MTLENCFNTLTAPAFPCTNRAFSVVAFLSDGYGDLRMQVGITHLETGRPVYAREHTLRIADRLHEVRYRFQVTGCVFTEPGVYEVHLACDGEVIADTRVTLISKEAEG